MNNNSKNPSMDDAHTTYHSSKVAASTSSSRLCQMRQAGADGDGPGTKTGSKATSRGLGPLI